MSNSKSIEDMLREGATAEELRLQFDQEIGQAQAKIKQEKEDKAAAALKEGLNEIRRKLIITAVEYLNAIDVVDREIAVEDEELDKLVDMLAESEDTLKMYGKIVDALHRTFETKEKTDDEVSFDNIIDAFLKTI